MKTLDEIKLDAFKEFLMRLANHKIGECMDLVPTPGFYIK